MASKPIEAVPWYLIEIAVNELANHSGIRSWKEEGSLIGIVPVAMGGLIPGGMLGYRLGLHDLWPVKVTSYHNQQRGKIEAYIPERLEQCKGAGYLIVDDICDSGGTLRYLKERLPEARTAALFTKTDDPDFWARRAADDKWLGFPWERGLNRD